MNLLKSLLAGAFAVSVCMGQSSTDKITVKDADGNVYQTVKIGNQVWTVENLRTTKYNDGSAIPVVRTPYKTPMYCYYNNTTNADTIKRYGALYNWYAVDTKKLAPAGWHVPTTIAEWAILVKYLIENGYNWDGTTDTNVLNKKAKAMAAKTDWYIDTTPGAPGNDMTKNNRSGFSALPGGARSAFGRFYNISGYGLWWIATELDASIGWSSYLGYGSGSLGISRASKSCGTHVRLLRD